MTASAMGIGCLVGGRYAIEGTLGVGGMGRVLVARDRAVGDEVAIKVLRAELCEDPLTRRRFLREARLLERLRCDHVVGLRDFGFHERHPYLVMDLLDGTDLGDVLEVEGDLPESEAIAVARQLCAALAVVHAAGAVHRDLKPENVILTTDASTGRTSLKLIDFGVATDEADEQILTNVETFVGTAVYTAPEQIRSAHDVDGRADIWGIGVMLYEMVTGEQPFEVTRSIVQLLKDVLEGEPRPPSQLAAVSPKLEAIITKCLAKNPDDRFAHVQELDAALARLAIDGELPPARRSQVRARRTTTLPAPPSHAA